MLDQIRRDRTRSVVNSDEYRIGTEPSRCRGNLRSRIRRMRRSAPSTPSPAATTRRAAPSVVSLLTWRTSSAVSSSSLQLDVDRGDTVTDQIIEQRALGSGAAQLVHHGDVIGDQTDPRSLTFDKGIGALGRRVADVLGAVQQLG